MNIPKISERTMSQPPTNHNKGKNEKLNQDAYSVPVEDETLLPRCEFYHRFDNTSRFQNDIKRAHIYTRSEGARYAQGNKSAVKFVPTPLTNGLNKATNSLSAHTGGFANPYVLSDYSNNIQLKKYHFDPQYQKVKPKLYDKLLSYKLGLCNHIANEFSKQIPHADLGGSRYRAKLFSAVPTINNFKDAEIIIRKWKSRKDTWIELYTVIKGKVDSIDVSDNQTLVDKVCDIRVGSDRKLEKLLKEFQPYLISKNLHPNRDMQGVYCSNKYPCVLVRLTPKITDKSVSAGELETIYKRYNHLLMAYFIAIVDYNAYTAGIEIEMLGRSGFGQNNPGIAVTDKSFRINIGLVPKAYADIIVKSLVQLHALFRLLENAESDKHLKMERGLKNKLDKAREVGFNEPTLPATYWEALWAKGSHGSTGRIMLHELIERERDRPELLANFVLKAIINNPVNFFENPALAEAPLGEMFKLVEYSESGKISVNSKPTLEKQPFFQSTQPSDKKVSDDPALYSVIKKLCHGLAVDLPKDLKIRDLYRFLETSHITFICEKRTRTLSQLNKLSDWGSDSETEEPDFVKAKSIFAKKVVIANGMLAINLSYYAARSAIYFIDAIKEMAVDDVDTVFKTHHNEMAACSRKISINCNNTYFETISGNPRQPLCLDAATNPPVQKKDAKADILIFDLNSFKADFIAQKANLRKQLKITRPMVVILDHTSSTTDRIREAIKTVYECHPGVYMVLLVTSGLKNEQGGGDNNPYGKLTILSLADKGETNTLTHFIYDEITALRSADADVKLSKKALLPKAAHAIRHSYKDRGFTTTAYSILHDDSDDAPDHLTDSETSSESVDNDELTHIDNAIQVLTLRDI